jgi:hypothetical protein
MHRFVLAVLPLGLAICPLAARAPAQNQVLLVTQDGTGFSSVQAAVNAAADGDVILIRPGAYVTAFITNKSLTLARDGGESGSALLHHVTISNLAAGKKVVLRGLTIQGAHPFSPEGTAVSAFDVAGSVVIEDCELRSGYPAALRASQCQGLFVVRSLLEGLDGVPQILFEVPARPGAVLTGSNAFFYESTAIGGKGIPGAVGAPGVLLDGGTLLFSGSAFVGGDGGKAAVDSGGCATTGGNGGAGLAMQGASPLARRLASTLSGGAGGAPESVCAGGAPGPDLVLASGTLLTIPEPARSLELSAPVREGQVIELEVRGEPFEVAKIVFSATPVAFYAPGLLGAILPSPAALGIVVLGPLPASGEMVLSLPIPASTLPPGVQGIEVYAQGLFDAVSSSLGVLSAPTVTVLLDASL